MKLPWPKLLIGITLLMVLVFAGLTKAVNSCPEIKDHTTLHGHDADTIFSYDPKMGELAKAAATGNICKIEKLVNEGVNVNGSTAPDALFSPLAWAVQAQNKEGIKKLVELGADPSLPFVYPSMSSNWTEPAEKMAPIYLADHPDIVKLLLELGADPNGVDEHGNKPVIINVMRGLLGCYFDTVKLLVEYGADVNFSKGATPPLNYAISVECYDIADYLIEQGANTSIISAYTSLKNKRRRLTEEEKERIYPLEVKLYNMGGRYYPPLNNEEFKLKQSGIEIKANSPHRLLDVKPGEDPPNWRNK